MDVFDCHVNRSPCSGVVSEILYVPGKFLMLLWIKQVKIMREIIIKLKFSQGEIIVVQIAGLIARRIVTETSKDWN